MYTKYKNKKSKRASLFYKIDGQIQRYEFDLTFLNEDLQ